MIILDGPLVSIKILIQELFLGATPIVKDDEEEELIQSNIEKMYKSPVPDHTAAARPMGGAKPVATVTGRTGSSPDKPVRGTDTMATTTTTNTATASSAAQITANLHSLFDNLSVVGSQAMQGQNQSAMQGQNASQLSQNQLSSLVNASMFGGMGLGGPAMSSTNQAQLLMQMSQLQQQQQAYQQLQQLQAQAQSGLQQLQAQSGMQQLQAQSGQQQLINQTMSMLQANAQAQLAMNNMGMNPALNNMLFNANPMAALGRGMGTNPLLGSLAQGAGMGFSNETPFVGRGLGRGMPRQNPDLKPPPGGLQKKFNQS